MAQKKSWWQKVKRQDWGNFTLQFLAVMLGIIVTFTGEALIERSNTNKEVKATLQLVISELEDNMHYIADADSIWKLHGNAVALLTVYKDSLDKMPPDTMTKYQNMPVMLYHVTASTEALDLLKSTGVFSKIEDKSLALDIIHAYGHIADYMSLWDFYYNKKKDLVEDAMTPEFKEMVGEKKIITTGTDFWNQMLTSREGRFMLSEQLIMAMQDLRAGSEVDKVTPVIERLKEYCE